MKVIFMAKETTSSIMAINYLVKKAEISCAVIRERDKGLKKICDANKILTCTEEELLSEYDSGRLKNIDYMFSFYWKKTYKETLDIPNKGSINFHPGPLPEARGSGYHIAILNGWQYWGVTAHFMDQNLDTGAIITCNKFPISNNIVNRDLVALTHKHLGELFKMVIDKILCGEELLATCQGDGFYYSLQDVENNKLILPNENSQDIDRKIRAYWNPPYSGATIEVAGKYYTVINDDILNYIAEHTNG